MVLKDSFGMEKNSTYNLLLFLIVIFFGCNDEKNNSIEFYRENKSIVYEVWQKAWRDTFKVGTGEYDTGIPCIVDKSRNLLFIFDNALFLYKINSQIGTLLDSINLLSRYTYRMAPQDNKLLYSYPALFFYHKETIIHLDMDFNLRANYLDSISTELKNRLPDGYYYEYYIDSTNVILPNKLWIRLNDYHGCLEEMVFGVSVQMEPPVIHSIYIVR